MMTVRIFYFIILSFACLHSKAQEGTTFDTKEYAITYPKDWTFDTSGQMNTTFLIFSKLEEEDTFSENVNLMIQDLTGMDLDLKGYTELSVNQIKAVQDSEIFESKDLKKGTLAYHQIVWKGFVTGKKLKFKQLYYIKKNRAFLVTLTCEEDAYDAYEKVGSTILNSFILK